MFWIIGSLALILFMIFFMCMVIGVRSADEISRVLESLDSGIQIAMKMNTVK